ncbi:MAG: DNA polymerase IV [Acidimicrobiia bacterium]
MSGAGDDVPAPPAILHLDLDAFFAAVEQVADPSLRGRPVVVGGLGPRGVVAAASYEARRFGIFSATPMARARRACPDAVFLAPRFDAYAEKSAEVMGILRAVTPLVEPISLDEAFLDVRGARRRLGTGPEIAASLRAQIRAETGLTASVGVATTKMLAKIASDEAKPDGLLVVPAGEELDFLHPLPIRRLWGVGPATQRRLDRFGVVTVGDLAALPETTLVHALGVAHGEHLHALSWNRDARDVELGRRVKSVGHEETFPADVRDRDVLRHEVRRLSEQVGERLRRAGQAARTVQLKVRYHDFRTITRSRTLAEATDLSSDVTRTALDLLDAVEVGDGVRLLGVSAQQLESATAIQRSLFPDDAETTPGGRERRGRLERSVDAVRERFGQDAVLSARRAPRPDGDRGPQGESPEGEP